ncbi:MAG TPA: glycerol-3-phosphate 1-O-acyltransferase PlsY [bacterium]|nr:glycerol-3-phosphate 1-O-acyltransferase PlsY [bacterium]HOL47689.1 glycerol-3-phosphate 1-O-acyltransferase PlsY [bacterium]HPQ18713.1 glycerol-3-phosphate 1-O-acyltransferase PlsY [bacterium]
MNYLIIFIHIFILYLIGSFPTAYIVGKLVKNIDIRNYGSGNVGATNVFRTLGKKYGIFVLIIDILKGFLPLLFIKNFSSFSKNDYFLILCGCALVAGHIWTIFLSFKGGKGVATATGVFLALVPYAVLICFFIFVLVVFLTHYISAGSIIAAFLLPFFVLIFYSEKKIFLLLAILISVFVIYKHKSNIIRIIKKEEHKFF